ncbi:regulatory protein RecX [Anaerocolumna xylanovorans]|uniref:Regulatory protein RecX n=1 Tax=Anaerocolumna xylanovorans DSM 12503 TaxID=1121345 RepID=A0A1M7Y2C3_9FIRM|nr:regulatory protein RecX [Anaerocolumna xylanovorans]SHO46085.1 regulatory protein [Anaerocolumna xylanovorans DSM 12503]
MIITDLEECNKNKVKVYIDERYCFILYDREIRKYGLEKEKEIPDALVDELTNSFVKKAKKKAMDLLKNMDRTETEIKRKLEYSGYTEEIIEEAIEYVKSYHYIDDLRYACNYIHLKKQIKSRRQILGELKQKGISDTDIEEALFAEYDNEEEAIQREISKKVRDVEDLSRDEKQKLAAKLYRKGYGMDLIRRYMKLDS